MEDIIKSLKYRPGVSNLPDELLEEFILDAEQTVKDFINYSEEEELPKGCLSAVKELVIIRCNTLGSEGLSSQNVGGASESYLNDIPKPLKKQLYRYRKIRW